MFEPWRGEHYEKDRLLLLGESAYSWPEEGEPRHPSMTHPKESVEWIIKKFPDIRTLDMLTRAITGKYDPSEVARTEGWATVGFTNYVDGSAGEGPRQRPATEQWLRASEEFRELLDNLRPRNVVVLGRDMWRGMPESDVHVTDDIQGYRMKNGEISVCWAVPHPARGLAWESLAYLIRLIRKHTLD